MDVYTEEITNDRGTWSKVYICNRDTAKIMDWIWRHKYIRDQSVRKHHLACLYTHDHSWTCYIDAAKFLP